MKKYLLYTFILLIIAGSFQANAQLITISVSPRGYADISAAERAHFVPFAIAEVHTGMKPGDPIEEITAEDIMALSKQFDRTVIVRSSSTCKVQAFPLSYWQELEDTLHAHNSRLLVITGRYDEYGSLQKALAAQPVTYKVYVLSGAKYGDNYFKMNKIFWKQMVGKQYGKNDRFKYDSMLMVLDKNGLKGFVPNISMMSYN